MATFDDMAYLLKKKEVAVIGSLVAWVARATERDAQTGTTSGFESPPPEDGLPERLAMALAIQGRWP